MGISLKLEFVLTGSYRSNKVSSRPTTINSAIINGHSQHEARDTNPPTPTTPVAAPPRTSIAAVMPTTNANNAAARKNARQSNVVKEVRYVPARNIENTYALLLDNLTYYDSDFT